MCCLDRRHGAIRPLKKRAATRKWHRLWGINAKVRRRHRIRKRPSGQEPDSVTVSPPPGSGNGRQQSTSVAGRWSAADSSQQRTLNSGAQQTDKGRLRFAIRCEWTGGQDLQRRASSRNAAVSGTFELQQVLSKRRRWAWQDTTAMRAQREDYAVGGIMGWISRRSGAVRQAILDNRVAIR